MTKRPLFLILALLTTSYVVGQSAASPAPASFAPLNQWKSAVLSGNSASLNGLYSSRFHATTVTGDSSPDAETSFWTGLKPLSMKLDLVQSESPQPGLHQVVFQAEVRSMSSGATRTLYVMEGQLWQDQGGKWKLVAAKRGDATRLQQPTSTSKIIYAPGMDAHEEIKHALGLAAKQHKNVLLVFGANWCYDCHVLDLAFERPELASVLQRNYEVVHVDVGQYDKNMDIAQQYKVPLNKGVPALAVLNSQGKLVYSQQTGEFEKARSLAPEDLLAFLNRWKPSRS